MIQLSVARERAGLRLDRFLAVERPDFSRARLQTLIREGFVTLNGKSPRPRDLVRSGDSVELTEPALEKTEAQPEQIALEILFEDDDLLVLSKPAGLVMHPGAGHQQHTLVNDRFTSNRAFCLSMLSNNGTPASLQSNRRC